MLGLRLLSVVSVWCLWCLVVFGCFSGLFGLGVGFFLSVVLMVVCVLLVLFVVR